jgi:hypothetical protein
MNNRKDISVRNCQEATETRICFLTTPDEKEPFPDKLFKAKAATVLHCRVLSGNRTCQEAKMPISN